MIGIMLHAKVTHTGWNIQETKLNNWNFKQQSHIISCPRSTRDFCLFQNIRICSGQYPSSCLVGTVWLIFQGKRSHDFRLITHQHLVPGSRIRESITQPYSVCLSWHALWQLYSCLLTCVVVVLILFGKFNTIIWTLVLRQLLGTWFTCL